MVRPPRIEYPGVFYHGINPDQSHHAVIFLELAPWEKSVTFFAMHDKLNIIVEHAEPEFIERAARYRANGEWLTEHAEPWFAQFPGKYIAVSEGEVFVADDALEARRLASLKHPGDVPFVQYIPCENRPRIYAC